MPGPTMPTERRYRLICGKGALCYRSASFDEGHLVDFFQGGDAVAHLLDSRFAQERHAFLTSGALDFRGRAFVKNHLADLVTQVQQFVDRAAAAESGAAALQAAGA